MRQISIGVLRGGPSAEHQVSLKTGAGVLAALRERGYRVKDIMVDRKGQWLHDGFVKSPTTLLQDVDVVFIALHGQYGEDGTVQRILERHAVPYTGSHPYPSAMAMNKVLTKDHLKESGLRFAKHMHIKRVGRPDPQDTAETIEQLFGANCIVKPLFGGSSLDTKRVRSVAELSATIKQLLETHEELIVEEFIEGKEATVGILEGYRGERWYKMPVVEIVPPKESGFFAADVKYTGDTEEICPGRFSEKERDTLHEAALAVHNRLGLRHYSRSDFIVTPDGPVFLEVNTLPGLTDQSLFPKALEAVGGSYGELISHLVDLAQIKVNN